MCSADFMEQARLLRKVLASEEQRRLDELLKRAAVAAAEAVEADHVAHWNAKLKGVRHVPHTFDDDGNPILIIPEKRAAVEAPDLDYAVLHGTDLISEQQQQQQQAAPQRRRVTNGASSSNSKTSLSSRARLVPRRALGPLLPASSAAHFRPVDAALGASLEPFSELELVAGVTATTTHGGAAIKRTAAGPAPRADPDHMSQADYCAKITANTSVRGGGGAVVGDAPLAAFALSALGALNLRGGAIDADQQTFVIDHHDVASEVTFADFAPTVDAFAGARALRSTPCSPIVLADENLALIAASRFAPATAAAPPVRPPAALPRRKKPAEHQGRRLLPQRSPRVRTIPETDARDHRRIKVLPDLPSLRVATEFDSVTIASRATS